MTPVLLAIALAAPPPTAAGDPPVLVLAVGANRGLPTEQPLRYAHRDAAQYASTLAAVTRAPLRHQEVLEDPTRRELLQGLARLAEAAAAVPGAQVHFYFSGHGDRSSLHLGPERLGLAELTAQIEASPGRIRLAVIDACRSPSVTLKGFERGPAFDVQLSQPNVAGTVILNAASDGEAAQESEDTRGAVFTQALLTGLRGAADVDGDRRVTLSELYRHAYRQTVLRSSMMPGNVMHPSARIELEGAGEVVVGRPAPRTASVTLPAEAGARYVVFDRQTSAVVAEVWSDPDRDVRLPLTPGRYLVTRRRGMDSAAQEVQLDPGDRRLSGSGFQAIDAERLAQKGGRLRLLTHELRAGGAATYRLGLGQQAFIGYGFGTLRWRGEVTLRLGRSSYSGRNLDFTTLEPEVELRGLYRRGAFDLIVAAVGRSIRETGTVPDGADQAALGFATERTATGFGFGPKVAARYRFSLSDRWALGFELGGSTLFINEEDGMAVRPEAQVDVGIGYEL